MSTADHDPSNKLSSGAGSDTDAEKINFSSDDVSSHHALQRQLKNRHIAMIR